MSSTCNTCGNPIRWDKAQREKLGIRGPLNEDLTAHLCYAKVKEKQEIQQTLQKQPKTETTQNMNPSVVRHTNELENRVAHLETELKKLKEWIAVCPMS